MVSFKFHQVRHVYIFKNFPQFFFLFLQTVFAIENIYNAETRDVPSWLYAVWIQSEKLDENAVIYRSEIIMNLLLSLLFMIYREEDGFSKGNFASFRQMAFNFARNRLWFSSITFLELKKTTKFFRCLIYPAEILVNGLCLFCRK